MNDTLKKSRIKSAVSAAVVLLTSFLMTLTLSCLPTEEDAEIYDNIIRLHVIADSDGEEAQALKLKVRDAVLELASALFEEKECKTLDEASETLTFALDGIKTRALGVLKENGCDMDVKVELSEEEYPTRSYEEVSLPSGRYLSLRVTLGSGEGKNWWCVLFPPLCLSSASAKEELLEAGFTKNQIRILTDSDNPRYVLKFRFLEFFKNLF